MTRGIDFSLGNELAFRGHAKVSPIHSPRVSVVVIFVPVLLALYAAEINKLIIGINISHIPVLVQRMWLNFVENGQAS